MNTRSSFANPLFFSIGREALPGTARRIVASSSRAIAEGTSLSDDAARLAIAAIDWLLASQLDAILHHPSFQRLESAWRELAFVVERTDFCENIRIELVSCSKEDLRADFDRRSELVESGLFVLVSSPEPFGAIVSNYEFEPDPRDIGLLRRCASVAAAAQAPFLAGAAPGFFGLEKHAILPELPGLRPMFGDPRYADYNAFRDEDESRYVALFVPRFLLRLPFGAGEGPAMPFEYEEDVARKRQTAYCWGSASFAFATRLADSFARYRWCPNVTGEASGGAVENLPIHDDATGMGTFTQIPTDAALSERREYELSEEGFIALAFNPSSRKASFLSARSVQRPKYFGRSEEDLAAEMNHRLGTELPYLFVACRIAHYLEVIHRQYANVWRDRIEIEIQLGRWLQGITCDARVGTPRYTKSHPIRKSQFELDSEGEGYRLRIRPRFKYHGAFCTLTLRGRLGGLPAGATARREQRVLPTSDSVAFPLRGESPLPVDEVRFARGGLFDTWPVFDSADDTLVLASSDRTVRVLDTASWTVVRTLPGPQVSGWLALTARRGELAAQWEDNRWWVWLWRVDGSGNVSLVMEPDSRTRVSSFGPRLWLGVSYDASEEPHSLVLMDPATGEKRTLFKGDPTASAMSPDGSVVVSSSTDATIVFHDAASGELLRTIPSHSATAFAFRADGRILASAAGTIRLWDAATGSLLGVIGSQPSPVTGLAISCDGETLAGVSADGAIRLWSTSSGALLHELRGQASRFGEISLSRDGAFLVSTSEDVTSIWSVTTGARLAAWVAFEGGYALVAADGRFKLSGDPRGKLWFAAAGRRIEAGEIASALRVAEDAPFPLR